MTGRHDMYDGNDPVTVDVPTSGGENVMVPVIRAVVRSPDHPDSIVLQRRDDPSESVLGRLEIPGGRWRSGESPVDAITREVVEETGLEVTQVHGVAMNRFDDKRSIASLRPLVVVAGVGGAFPAAHVVLIVDAVGQVRPEPGESADVRWWHVDAVRRAMDEDRDAFIPSTFMALRAYLEWLGSALS